MKTKIWMYVVLLMVWGVIATAVLSGGEGVSIWQAITISTTVSDTATDVMSGTVDDGDSAATFIVTDEADFRAFEGGDGGAQAIWFDTAAWSDTGTFSANDSNIATSWNPVIYPRANLSGNKGWETATVTVDSGDNDFTVAIASATNDSEFVLLEELPYDVAGLPATFTFNHDTLEMVIDSIDATLPDTVLLTAELGHVVAGWNYRIWRGGEITTYVDTGAWFFVAKAHSYDIHFRCVKFSQKDSVIAKTKLQSKRVIDDIDQQPVNICSSAVCTDTTLAPANFYRYPFLDSDGGPDTTWANGGFLGVAFRYITTVVDSESRPAYYGRHDYVRFFNVIEAKY